MKLFSTVRTTTVSTVLSCTIGICTLLGAHTASADTPTAPSPAIKLKVAAILTVPNYGLYVYFNGNHQCSAIRVRLSHDRSDFKVLYAALLTAQTAQTTLTVDLTPETGGTCNSADSTIGMLCIGSDPGPCFSN